MVWAVEEAHRAFRAELVRLLNAALSEHDVLVSADHGPLRRLKVTVLGRSPLYRSPPEPGSAFVVEARST